MGKMMSVDRIGAAWNTRVARDYLNRGRCHAAITDSELIEIWVVCFRNWALNFDDESRLAECDASGELILRGIETPDKRVSDANALLRSRCVPPDEWTDEERARAYRNLDALLLEAGKQQ